MKDKSDPETTDVSPSWLAGTLGCNPEKKASSTSIAIVSGQQESLSPQSSHNRLKLCLDFVTSTFRLTWLIECEAQTFYMIILTEIGTRDLVEIVEEDSMNDFP
ncbi:hypothetical protein L1887_39314 [Cichorium endivia]|nr:hypothetical protein L1887_39314 [Cichorium endivia]